MIDLKTPAANDTQAVKKLWKTCFGDSGAYINLFFETVYQRENALAIKKDGEIISFLMTLPETLWVNGEKRLAHYIGGVCTAPSHRRKGYAAYMVKEAVKSAKERGAEISYLIPFRCDFYRKLGFECISYLTVLEGNMNELLPFETEFEERDSYLEIYNEFCRGRDFYAERNKSDFSLMRKFQLLEGGNSFSSENGYVFYTLHDGVFDVSEIAYKNEKGFCEMLTFILRSGAEKFRIRGAFDMCDMLCETEVSIKLHPCAMVNGNVNIKRNTENYINMPIWA